MSSVFESQMAAGAMDVVLDVHGTAWTYTPVGVSPVVLTAVQSGSQGSIGEGEQRAQVQRNAMLLCRAEDLPGTITPERDLVNDGSEDWRVMGPAVDAGGGMRKLAIARAHTSERGGNRERLAE